MDFFFQDIYLDIGDLVTQRLIVDTEAPRPGLQPLRLME